MNFNKLLPKAILKLPIMKKITALILVFCALFQFTESVAQKVVVIGMNHVSSGPNTDGFAFVATENIPNGEIIYFTENEYVSGTNAFDPGEAVIIYTSPGLTTGDVVFIDETSTNTYSLTCNSGSGAICGTAAHSATNGSFSVSTNGDGLYAYADTNDNPGDGITEIYSVLYTGSGELPTQNGGNIPAGQSPLPDYPNAIVVDGFPDDGDINVGPDRVEFMFSPASMRDGVSKTALENPINYLSYVANQALSVVPFTNLNLGGANPVATLSVSSNMIAENSGGSITITATLDAAATAATTVNLTITGTAANGADYSLTGTSITIANGATTGSITLSPTGDTTLEPNETAILTIASGTGYDAGSPSSQTITITNDDTVANTPVVAVTGTNHSGTDGFSFVALDDITAGTQVYFTDYDYSNATLAFSAPSQQGVMLWTAPVGGVTRGQVIVATETAMNVFTTTCDSGTCGTMTLVAGTFALATDGEAFYAYTDSDSDPTNGVTEISSVLYTGLSASPGGNISADRNPNSVYTGAIVVDGFPNVSANRTEYDPTKRNVNVDQAVFQNTTNWVHAQASATLDTTPFANIIITTGSADPSVSVTVSPATVVEDSGTAITYTFTLSAAATASTTINFTVGGTATFPSDYSVSGTASFTATSGSIVIPNGASTAAFTATPIADTTVETLESIEIMIDSGTGYIGGSPNDATATISNDDTSMSDPLVAITGLNHVTPDAFSFVAAQEIPANTVIYFTDKSFDNTTLTFGPGETVFTYTSPGVAIPQGDVIVVKEDPANTYSLTCNGASGAACGTIIATGAFNAATAGETFYAYEDSDADPTNGVDDIYAVLYTGNGGTGISGGPIPAIEDPSGIYLSALVVDGFPAVPPNRTEYDPTLRNIPVSTADFENVANWVHAQPNADLSPVPFASIAIVATFTALADLCIDAGVQTGLGGGSPTGGVYSGPGVTDDGNGMTYSFDPAAAGVGVHTLTYSVSGNTATDDVEVFALPTVGFTAPADLCVDAGVQAGLGGGTPTGGVYSGPGVTDDGNGMTYSFDPAAAGVGTHTITYNFTDGNGCSGSASDDIEVFALPVVTFTAPADLCIDEGVQTGLGGGTPTGGVYSGPGVTDDGNGMTYSFDPAAAGVGVHTLTYTFTNGNSCTNSATDNVEVFNTPTVTFTAPADLCIDAGVQAGLGGGTPTGGVYSGPGVTDDGNGMTYSFDPAAAGVGVHTITYTFTDGNSCTNSASDNVEVFALPTVTFTALADLCVDAGVQAGLSGGTPTGGVYSGPGVTDDGNGMTYSFDPAAAGVGTHTITYDFTDGNGCSGSANDDVEVFALPTVTFTAPASPVCPTLVLTGQGGGTPTGGVYSGPGVTDDGNGMTYTFDTNASGTGTHTITYTFTDGNGCTASASDMVTVEDNDPPVITCPGDITVDNDPGQCGAIVNFAATATDNCPSTVTITYSQDPGTEFAVGTTVVTATATDGGGNTSTCTFNITVNDAEDPTITCPVDITQSTDPGVCGAVINYTAPVAADNCGGLIVTETFNFTGASQTFIVPTGVTSVSIDAFGAAGQDMIIEDFDPSTGGLGGQASGELAVTPGDVLTIFVGGAGTDGVGGFNGGEVGGFGTPTTGTGGFAGSGGGASDVRIGGTSLTDRIIVAGGGGGSGRDYVNGTCTPCGIGGDGGAGGGFTGIDGEDPSWSGILGSFPNVGAGGKGGTPTMGGAAGDGPNGPAGNPGALGIGGAGVNGTQSVASGGGGGGYYGGGSGGGGDSGNGVAGAGGAGGSSYVGGVTSGTTNPGIRAGDGEVIITYTQSLVVTQTAGLASGSTFPVGTTTNTFVVTDGAGNTATCSFDVTINDTEAPMITCPGDIMVNNDPGDCAAIVSFMATATDNCSAMVTYSQDPGTSFPVGTTTVTATATDPAGNTASCTFDVTVTDNEPPVAVCMDLTVQLDASGNASITPADIDGGSSDNCGIASLAITPSTFSCADVGPNTVTLTVTDVNGNSSTCTSTVTVEDNVPPVAVCQDITIQLDANGDASIVPADVDGGSTDACGIASIAIDIDTFTCADVGPNNVTLTVTDVNGNSSSCVAVVTVEDNIPPTITCPADIDLGTDTGICGALVNYPDPLPTDDNCGVASITQTAGLPSGSIFPVGMTVNTFVVTDLSGNTATCSFTVTITDDEPPVAVCQDITVQLDASGSVTILASDVDGGSTDNCSTGSLDLLLDIDTFTCADVGPNTVTLTVIDEAGLSSTCTATVTVEDVTPPVAVCQNIIVQLDATGNVTIDPSLLDNGSTDECGGTLTYTASPDTFDCSNVGANTVTLTVTDSNGNSSTCTGVVLVEDNVNPVVTCMDMTVSLDENGLATIDPADLVLVSDDACGITTTTASITEFDCDDVGTPVNVTVTVTDPSGNTASCTATVTVLDEIAPELDCPAEVTVQTEGGTQYEVEDFIASGIVGATDNCSDPVTLVSQDPAVGTLLDPGVYPVTITVADDSGNEASCVFDLIVEETLGAIDNSFDISSITMFPNPASDFVTLGNPQQIPLKDVAIYDVTGRLIKTLDAETVTDEMKIDIYELASATYLFIINTADGVQVTQQIVKE
ncbi:MAG: hypothetical protein CMC13_13190 [Flavobacteriaceae bacterium]|nr:hypothetical protein [Flavobacteriaceae bacterium]